jgi:hypothetical protein
MTLKYIKHNKSSIEVTGAFLQEGEVLFLWK